MTFEEVIDRIEPIANDLVECDNEDLDHATMLIKSIFCLIMTMATDPDVRHRRIVVDTLSILLVQSFVQAERRTNAN